MSSFKIQGDGDINFNFEEQPKSTTHENFGDLLENIFSYLDSGVQESVAVVSQGWNKHIIKQASREQAQELKGLLEFVDTLKSKKASPNEISRYKINDEKNPILKSINLLQIKEKLSDVKELLLIELRELDKGDLNSLVTYFDRHNLPAGFKDFIEILDIDKKIFMKSGIFYDNRYKGMDLEKVLKRTRLYVSSGKDLKNIARHFHFVSLAFESERNAKRALEVLLEIPKVLPVKDGHNAKIFHAAINEWIRVNIVLAISKGNIKINDALDNIRILQDPNLKTRDAVITLLRANLAELLTLLDGKNEISQSEIVEELIIGCK